MSGVSDFLAQNEYHAIQLAREIVGNFNWKKKTPFPPSYFEEIEEPLYDPGFLIFFLYYYLFSIFQRGIIGYCWRQYQSSI